MSTAIILQIDKILRTESSFAFRYSTEIHDTLFPANSIQEVLQRPLARHGYHTTKFLILVSPRSKIPLTICRSLHETLILLLHIYIHCIFLIILYPNLSRFSIPFTIILNYRCLSVAINGEC